MASGSGCALNREQQLEYHIGGVCIKFPCKPYPTQVAMMAKIIKALTHKENALLESPTGSGKSLALLCSTLAWLKMDHQVQQAKLEEEKMKKDLENTASVQCVCQCHVTTATSLSVNQAPPTSSVTPPPSTPQEQTQPMNHQTTTITSNELSRVGGVSLPKMILSPSASETAPELLPLATTNQIAATTDTSNNGGVDGEPVKGEPDVIMLDDSMEEDFKMPRKRLRQPTTTGMNKTKKLKGVVYEDAPGINDVGELPPDQHGHATWTMECTSTIGGVAPGVGIPASQIMDTGLGTSNAHSTASTSTSVTTSSSLHSCVKCGCQPKLVKQENLAKPVAPNRYSGPKIYFGTRTHKQITQITHEMARTVYSDTPMSILASREHTCVHPVVSTNKNKNEECKKLLDYDGGVSCTFYHRLQQKMGSQAQLRQLGYSTAWDIEDLVKLGKRVRACPYFATRALMEDADIIFCPYNYLIDPMIRDQMLIDIEDKVIVLDEAHNMEDSAREAASLSLTITQLTEILTEIQDVLDELNSAIAVFSHGTVERTDCEELKNCYLHLQALGRSILRWIDTISPTLPSRGFEQAYGIWNGHDFVQILDKDFGLSPLTIEHYKTYLAKITEELKSNDRDKESFAKLPTIPMSSLNVFKSLLIVVGYLFKGGMMYLPDYRVSLMKTSTMARKPVHPGEWMSKRKRRNRALEKVWTFSLNFWCLNPAVAFSDLNRARSVILTSGTLSPMSSFSSELGVAFPIQLEANHVIPLTQTWVHSISHGPNGRPLNSTYQHSETFDFQDELGEAILKVCQTVPHGVLCFLSSYNMLEKLTKRWQETGVWYKILKEKLIVSEPRSGSKADFEAVMNSFYEVIEESSHVSSHVTGSHDSVDDSEGGHGSSGALFLAVCRGKVSEGLDFANNNARAVITVGIPFPYLKDKQVELKREYNNEHSHKRGLLTGSEWYEIQAYRALNQALGRCIRHKKDWGALILIDARYAKGPHYTKGLSKWVRQRISHMSDFHQAMSSLQGFVRTMVDSDGDINSTTTLSLVEKSPQASVSMATSMYSPYPSLPHKSAPPTTPSLDVPAPPPSLPLTSTPHIPRITNRVFPVSTQNGPLTQTPPTSGHTSQTNHPMLPHFGGMGEMLSQQKSEDQRKLFHSNSMMSPLLKRHQPPLSLSFNELPVLQASFQYPSGMTKIPVGTKVNDEEKQNSTFVDKTIGYGSTLDGTTTMGGSTLDGTATMGGADNTASEEGGLVEQDKPVASDVCDKTKPVELVSIASTPPSPPMCHVESPVLFEAPAIREDGTKHLITSTKQEPMNVECPAITADDGGVEHDGSEGGKTEQDNNVEISSDADRTPPISPKKFLPQCTSCDGGGCDGVKGEGRRVTRSNTRGKSKTDVPAVSGRMKTRRSNTRMARKSGHMLSPATKLPLNQTTGDSDDVDFKPARSRTPLKLRNEHHSQVAVRSKVVCACGHTVAESVSLEQVNLRAALKDHGYQPSTISSSQLWNSFKSWNKSRKNYVSVVIATSSDVKCATQKADGAYNAVWDDILEFCYVHLQCECGDVVGVEVYSHPQLAGKVIFHSERTSLQ